MSDGWQRRQAQTRQAVLDAVGALVAAEGLAGVGPERLERRVREELERALRQAYGRPIPVERPLVRFASWVGGDMDGNPNVDAGTIRATLARAGGCVDEADRATVLDRGDWLLNNLDQL